jgi:nucleotide-binding universal stress UspA family protein
MSTSTHDSKRDSTQTAESRFIEPLHIHTILVPIDLSEESYRALEFALPLAKRFRASVHIVHVYEGARQLSSIATSPVLFSEVEMERRLCQQVERRSGTRPHLDDCHIRTGKPFQEIIACSNELKADLIVIATHGQSGFRHLTLGSTTEKIIRHASCPVLVVREATRGPIKIGTEDIVLQKILVPVDFSERARTGAHYASRFATEVGADLLLIHVVQPPDYVAVGGLSGPNYWPPLIETTRLEAENKLDAMVNFLPLVGISAETQVEVGVPIEKLEEATARPDVDMVITSTHGDSGLRHAILGSIAEQLVRIAKCPVLVVPSHSRPMPTRK